MVSKIDRLVSSKQYEIDYDTKIDAKYSISFYISLLNGCQWIA